MRDRTKPALERLKSLVPNDRTLREIFGLQLGLADSQFFNAATLARYQLDRLKALARFALHEVPYWRTRGSPSAIERAATLGEALQAFPILSRLALRDHEAAFHPAALPPGQHWEDELRTSGSSGTPVTIRTTSMTLAWQNALGFRAYLWGGRDFSQSFAIIRRFPSGTADYPGTRATVWDKQAVFPFPTGPSHRLTALNTSIQQHWDWLAEVQPAYLLTHPSIVRGLAELAAEKGHPPAKLKGISTVAEMVDREIRDLAARTLGVEIHDVYSCTEGGVLAIQCSENRNYHIQSETVIVEILDENGHACRPGETGRVVVTPLFNFATPLFRYEVGDYAELGGPCPCGRGLPVLKRIMGRRRNLLTLPDGSRIWPSFSLKKMQKIARISRHRFVQTARDTVEVLLVTDEPISPEQETSLRRIAVESLPMPLTMIVRRVDDIPQPESGKYEEFVSLVD